MSPRTEATLTEAAPSQFAISAPAAMGSETCMGSDRQMYWFQGCDMLAAKAPKASLINSELRPGARPQGSTPAMLTSQPASPKSCIHNEPYSSHSSVFGNATPNSNPAPWLIFNHFVLSQAGTPTSTIDWKPFSSCGRITTTFSPPCPQL